MHIHITDDQKVRFLKYVAYNNMIRVDTNDLGIPKIITCYNKNENDKKESENEKRRRIIKDYFLVEIFNRVNKNNDINLDEILQDCSINFTKNDLKTCKKELLSGWPTSKMRDLIAFVDPKWKDAPLPDPNQTRRYSL